jgi:hypothetical protein
MKRDRAAVFRRNEIYVVATIIGVVFVGAMVMVGWLLKSSITPASYEALSKEDLKSVFATAYLRHREDDGKPYLKVECHNGTLWWIRKLTFQFDGEQYTVSDPQAFRPLHLGAVRCPLKKDPPPSDTREYTLLIAQALGYPPASVQWERSIGKITGQSRAFARSVE